MTTSTTHRTESMQFGHLRISFDDRVLRPRPWTTAHSDWAVELLRTGPIGSVLELCAGVGHIGLLTVARVPRRLVSVDADRVACAYARRNAVAAGLAELVDVREREVDDALSAHERFALVLADPPFVPHEEARNRPGDPLYAIDGGTDGLEVVWACVDAAREHLIPGGSLLLQLHSIEQVDAVRDGLRADLMRVTEVRWSSRGVLTRLDQAPEAA